MITGQVTDIAGTPVKGATVSTIAGHSTTTDAGGNYTLHLDAPGKYTVKASQGRASASRQVEVTLGSTTSVHLTLRQSRL